MDKKRAKFHNFYSDDRWGDASTYDLSINVAKLGIDETVELIANYISAKFQFVFYYLNLQKAVIFSCIYQIDNI